VEITALSGLIVTTTCPVYALLFPHRVFRHSLLLLMTHRVARWAASRRIKILAPGAARRHQTRSIPWFPTITTI